MQQFELISVNYKTPDLIERLIKSIRVFSEIQIRIIDGSDTEETRKLSKEVCEKYSNVIIEQLGYNVHHGRGLDYGLNNSQFEWVLCVDSDCEILQGMFECFQFTNMIEGFCYDCTKDNAGSNYLHPELCMVNVKKYKEGKLKFVYSGAPATEFNKTTDKLCMNNDYKKFYIRHGRGTCSRFGYNV